MTKHTSVVELNGHRYDAVSGQIIGAAKDTASRLRTASGSIDGFVRSKTISKVSLPPKSIVRSTAHHAQRHVQRSKTLMRKSVSKPESHKYVVPQDMIGPSSINKSGPKRSFRAKTVSKSNKIMKFGVPTKGVSHSETLSGEVLPLPPSKFAKSSKNSSKIQPAPVPSMVTSVSHQKLEKLLDHALISANSHKKTQHHKRGRLSRLFDSRKNLAAAAVISILIASVFAWQKIPQLSLRVAASKTHVDASVPAYVPPGFTLAGHAMASEGKVSLSFKSKEDPAKTFTITQRNSNLDSTAMASTLLPAKAAVQTSQIKGTTVYIYDNNNDAMWVNHGVHYQIHDKADLDSNEVLKIAQSL